ncbi:protein BREAKING OF ASYMMETRY IN THE STOMATAL LINEAGE-like [Andrographis paniculata]|uniref:protein BREAKING OF ASYMMETRY IN THE STOMATAL LINEAGE-like n=1 Tax=Andrographis paniculata TaxID=175694 RepID=UPI0021E744EE|nr:protein BREAKING OF ASYMMETRY IN THE STOMATAL LINEAGE-like [Andrographis paniculata]
MHCHAKFVPWKVKDLASCFHFCHIPLVSDKEPDICLSKPRLQTSKGSKVFDSKSGCKRSVKESTNAKKLCNVEEGGGESVERSSHRYKAGRARREAAFSEEDYIVFCFREDGKMHLIDEENSSEECQQNNEETKTTADASNTSQGNKKHDEKGSNKMCTKWPPDEDRKTKDVESHVDKGNESKTYPLDSGASSQSEGSSSTGSFTFPEVGTEWTGSPVHMPRAEKLEQEQFHNILHCYRF